MGQYLLEVGNLILLLTLQAPTLVNRISKTLIFWISMMLTLPMMRRKRMGMSSLMIFFQMSVGFKNQIRPITTNNKINTRCRWRQTHSNYKPSSSLPLCWLVILTWMTGKTRTLGKKIHWAFQSKLKQSFVYPFFFSVVAYWRYTRFFLIKTQLFFTITIVR